MNGPAGPLPPTSAGGAAPTFKLAAVQIAVPVLGGLLAGTALVYVLLAATGERMTAGELWVCVSAAVVASAALPLLPPSYGVELADSRLVIRGAGRREIEWRDITGLEIRRSVGVRTVVVSVTDGRRIPLRAPMSFLDRRFDDKVKVLTEWWTARRGGPEGA